MSYLKWKPKLEACPLCNSHDHVSFGAYESCTVCVRCYKCGAVVKESYPEKWPKHIDGSAKGALEKLSKWCLRRAIKKWNTRPDNPRPLAKKIDLYEQEVKLQELIDERLARIE